MIPPERLSELAAAQEPRADITNLFFVTPGEGVTELLLIRHGQTKASNDDHDLHLTETGGEQAAVLADYLGRLAIHAVYASPTTRTRETADFIAAQQGLSTRTLDDLRDLQQVKRIDRPFLEMLAAEFGPENVEEHMAMMRSEATLDAMAPFVEPSAAFRDRIRRALDRIIAEHREQRVAIVTHGPVITGYVAELLGTPRDVAVNPRLTSITRVFAREDMRTVDVLNAMPHFGVV